MEINEFLGKFTELYGHGEDIRVFHSPGRVNLIGEHTDYNGGYVFPCALSFGTLGAVRLRDDSAIKFASLNFDKKVETRLESIEYNPDHDWANYLKGVVKEFLTLGHVLGGFEILLYGSIPNSSGLSSSASIELLMAVTLNDMFGCGMDMLSMVRLCQRAENKFVGVNCGIMDQFAVGMGKKNMAMFLDCMKLDYEYIPFDLKGSSLIIGNTKVRRGLAGSKYNERHAECEQAVTCLRKKLDISYLGDISKERFEEYSDLIEDPIIKKRAAHVVYEDSRVLDAIGMLRAGNIDAFGVLMNQSHESLRDLYEVTGFELDTMVEEAWKIDGVIGSRMTGAGFGGCTVSIVRDESVDKFISVVGKNYFSKTGLNAEFYTASIGDGTRAL